MKGQLPVAPTVLEPRRVGSSMMEVQKSSLLVIFHQGGSVKSDDPGSLLKNLMVLQCCLKGPGSQVGL